MSIYNVILINKPVGKIEIIKNSVNKIQLSPWFNEVYSNPEEFIVSRIKEIVADKDIVKQAYYLGEPKILTE